MNRCPRYHLALFASINMTFLTVLALGGSDDNKTMEEKLMPDGRRLRLRPRNAFPF